MLIGSRPWKVVEFFRSNPDEMLHSSDVAQKWGAHPYQVSTILGPAVRDGLLRVEKERRDKAGGVRFVYHAGPVLLAQIAV